MYNNNNFIPQYNNYNPYKQVNNNTYAYVNGMEGAKGYQVYPNQTILLMDSDNPIFYLKVANQLGQSTIRTFKFEEVTESIHNTGMEYVTKEDFNTLLERIKVLEKGVNTNEPAIKSKE